MKKYQVWLAGKDCFDTTANNETEARANAREWLGKRLPKNTSVCEISTSYYQDIVDMNKTAGFHAGNL